MSLILSAREDREELGYGAIDDNQPALEWLGRAYREHNQDLIELTGEPSFKCLRADAKFRELVERIG